MLKYTKHFVYKPDKLKDHQREELQESSLLFMAEGDLGGE